jgi:uncharacterized membrane protein
VTDQASTSASRTTVYSVVSSALGVAVAFAVAVVLFAELTSGAVTQLHGLDAFLSVPSASGSIVFFAAFLVWNVGALAGARYPHRLRFAAIVVAAIGTLFQLVALLLGLSWYAIVLLLLAMIVLALAVSDCRANRNVEHTPQVPLADRPRILGIFLVLAGVAGLTAAYNLSVDKVTALISPTTVLNCDRSLIVQCSANLKSWQGSLFGFPNPLIGLGGFVAPIIIGIAILAGARFARWYWVAFTIGVIGALALIIFLISQSVFVIATLCLWCALVWTFTIPLFWLVTLYSLKTGYFRVSPRATKFFGGAYTWVPLITLLCYLVVALLYQVRLDALSYL